MSVPLVAIRHAPTAWNAERRLQGRTDVPLGAAGETAARTWRIDPTWRGYCVISSPLKRALTTARLLFPEAEITTDSRLIEMSFGAWEGKSLAELRGIAGGDAAERERLGLDFHAPEGESPRQVQARIQPLLQEIAEAGRPTVIVTHKALLRALLSLATGWDMTHKPPVRLDGECAHLFSLAADGMVSVVRMNMPLRPTVSAGPAS